MSNVLLNNKPNSYIPSFFKSILNGARSTRLNFEQASTTNIESTASFRYSAPGEGLKSTQQLNVDFSKFQNHTFFNSAEVNVNVAFDNIINGYPFDGARQEIERFFDGLTGFEKWVYDKFPKNKGFLFLNSSALTPTSITLNDFAGGLFPELSKLKSGEHILDPGTKSFSIEFKLFLPSTFVTRNSVVCQKLSGTNYGFSFDVDTGNNEIAFNVFSGSYLMRATASLSYGSFNHFCGVFDRSSEQNVIRMYKNLALTHQSTSSQNFGLLGITSSPLTISTGSTWTAGGRSFTPIQSISGALDEFRLFHSVRTLDQLKAYYHKAVYPTSDLKLYYKFNEPTGTLGLSDSDAINQIVLDSSGNALHASITNFSHTLRNTGSIEVPMLHEKLELSPILFPAHPDVIALNAELLASASIYDDINPNLITKLIPNHYLLESQDFEGFETEKGNLGTDYSGASLPGSGKLGQSQMMLTFLYVWAKYFDELKMFIDAFSKLHIVDYDATDTVPDNFLPQLTKYFGFNVPSFFNDASIEQFIDAENIEDNISTSQYSLKFVQNQILRRILTNMQEIVRSKGTLHSVKSFIRAVGVDPDNSFRIKEYGGPTTRQLTYARETKAEPGTMLSMSLNSTLLSLPLSSSRRETGYPGPRGTFVFKSVFPPHGVSNSVHDGLHTSGSWTYEAIYKYPKNQTPTNVTQSLARLANTGTLARQGVTLVNLVAISASNEYQTPSITLYCRPHVGTTIQTAPLLTMSLDHVDVFDGEKWNVSFGRQRGEQNTLFSTSSYFLRAARQMNGNIVEYYVTQSYFDDKPIASSTNMFETITAANNISGTNIIIGKEVTAFSGPNKHLDATLSTNDQPSMRAETFEGYVGQIRFWSKALTETEWKEHVRNYKSIGVLDPTKNFNFTTTPTGSFERLRLDVSTIQSDLTSSEFGRIKLQDYSQNNINMYGYGFPTSSRVIIPDYFGYSFISPNFDEAVSSDKIRVRSFQLDENVNNTPWAEVAPVHEINPAEKPSDDTRFSIEFSSIDGLNRDIINIFATLDAIDNAIGNPELLFSPDYPTLETLRDVYFNRLTSKVNLTAFFTFFKWFQSSIGSFIEQLIPKKTKFFGTNFVIESHMLERPKFEYHANDAYIQPESRINIKDSLLLEFIEGTLKRY